MSATQANAESTWRPKAVVFDLLTGLINSWSLWDASTPSGTETEGRRWRERYLEITFSAGAYVPYEDLVRQAAHEVGLPPSTPENLLNSWDSLQPWPEDGRVLQALRKCGYKLAVITNCSSDLGHRAAGNVEKAVNSPAGFTFDAVITAEESGFYKPVKMAYEAVLPALGLEASEVLFVAGSAGDVQGATNAGMKVVWHNKVGLARKGEAEPLMEGRSLDEALKGFL